MIEMADNLKNLSLPQRELVGLKTVEVAENDCMPSRTMKRRFRGKSCDLAPLALGFTGSEKTLSSH
jgi:hypothetical protein